MSACSATPWSCGATTYLAAVPLLHLVHVGRGQVLVLEPEVLQRPRQVGLGHFQLPLLHLLGRKLRLQLLHFLGEGQEVLESQWTWGEGGRFCLVLVLHLIMAPPQEQHLLLQQLHPLLQVGAAQRCLVHVLQTGSDVALSRMSLRFHHWLCKIMGGAFVFLLSAQLYLRPITGSTWFSPV